MADNNMVFRQQQIQSIPQHVAIDDFHLKIGGDHGEDANRTPKAKKTNNSRRNGDNNNKNGSFLTWPRIMPLRKKSWGHDSVETVDTLDNSRSKHSSIVIREMLSSSLNSVDDHADLTHSLSSTDSDNEAESKQQKQQNLLSIQEDSALVEHDGIAPSKAAAAAPAIQTESATAAASAQTMDSTTTTTSTNATESTPVVATTTAEIMSVTLEPPNEDSKVPTLTASAVQTTSDMTITKQRKKALSWGMIEFRVYETILGDNPSISAGPPLSIGWNFYQSDIYPLDQYETYRTTDTIRTKDALLLPRYVREERLFEFGYTRQDMIKRNEDIEIIKKSRMKHAGKHFRSKYLSSPWTGPWFFRTLWIR